MTKWPVQNKNKHIEKYKIRRTTRCNIHPGNTMRVCFFFYFLFLFSILDFLKLFLQEMLSYSLGTVNDIKNSIKSSYFD